jgi:RNA polymerase sigma factor (sigma-70 family)
MIKLTDQQRDFAAGYARAAAGIARAVAAAWNMLHVLDDLRGVAYQALSQAAHTFDGAKAGFRTHAWCRVTGAVLDAARKERKWFSRHAPLDTAAEIDDPGAPVGVDQAIDRIDRATADVMDAFAVACRAAELREGADVLLTRREDRAALDRALADLRPEDRRLFELRHRDELTWGEVAAALEIGETTAKERDARIRAALRKAMRGRRG